MTHVYGHNSILHNEEAGKLARATAEMLVVRKVSRQCPLPEVRQGGGRRKVARGRGVERQVVVQVRGSSNKDNVQLVKEIRTEKRQGLLELSNPELDQRD